MSLFDSLKRFFGSGDDRGTTPPETRGISCQEALRLVNEFIDGELENVPSAEVERHFEMCQRCYPHLRLERCFRNAIRRACAKEKAPAELRERVLNIVSRGGTDA
jgi:anti-sigma factor (TIGR02949 family)